MPLAIVGGIMIGLLVIAKLSGAIAYLEAPSNSGLPAIKQGDLLYSSNLPNPDRFEHIAFYSQGEHGKMIFVQRVCGLPGDRVEIRNGELFVNGGNADTMLNANYFYLIPVTQTRGVIEKFNLPEDAIQSHSFEENLVLISRLQAKELAASGISTKRSLIDWKGSTPPIFEQFSQSWNVDHFGPVTVPEGQYFVLGDNRYYAVDSRSKGFIKKDDILGVILNVQ